jgi:hypothetical protein
MKKCTSQRISFTKLISRSISSILLLIAVSTFVGCDNDDDGPNVLKSYELGIELKQHDAGELITSGNIQFEFIITNNGTTTIPKGSILFASARINDVLFSFDLLSSDPTEITLPADLKPGETYEVNPGYLEGKSTLAYLGVPSADFCIVLWGVGEESVDNIDEKDTDPSNNEVCVTYATYDLAVTLDGYTAGQVFKTGNVPLSIKVKNNSDVTFPAGTELKISARIAGTLFSLDLSSANPTTVPLTTALAPGASATIDAGFLNVELTLATLGITSADICVVVWGIGDSSVGETFPDDLDGSDNETCIEFSVE